MVLAERHIDNDSRIDGASDASWLSGVLFRNELSELVSHCLCWLAERQNEDGGWGDAEGSASTLTSTLLVQSAFRLTGVPARHSGALERAEAFVRRSGGACALGKRNLRDKTIGAAVLVNGALASVVSWRKTPSLTLEANFLPHALRRRWFEGATRWEGALRGVLGHACLVHAPPRNPLTAAFRRIACKRSLQGVEQLQGATGGFLESPPMTSFVVMSLASVGLHDHAMVRRGIEYLLSTVRRDGSWAIGSENSLWHTSQAAIALEWNFDVDPRESAACRTTPSAAALTTLDWILSRQQCDVDPATQMPAGGWASHGKNTGMTSTEATSSALLALDGWRRRWPDQRRNAICQAALRGCDWLMRLQNADGGWGPFASGTGQTWASTSGVDPTSWALRGLHSWRSELVGERVDSRRGTRLDEAIRRAIDFLDASQTAAGAWESRTHVDAYQPESANRVLGTAQALLALDALGMRQSESARRGACWLAGVQHASGGWGPLLPRTGGAPARTRRSFPRAAAPSDDVPMCTLEETALAVESLAGYVDADRQVALAVEAGAQWLVDAMANEEPLAAAPTNLDFARFSYADPSMPLLAMARALTRVHRSIQHRPAVPSASPPALTTPALTN